MRKTLTVKIIIKVLDETEREASTSTFINRLKDSYNESRECEEWNEEIQGILLEPTA